MSSPASLLDETRSLLDAAVTAYAGRDEAAGLQAIRDRLDDPLRVAIAGRVKAGKSTLLNALVGEELAPTDAGECTKIVTWYRDGVTYRVMLHPISGEPRQVPFTRDAGAIDVELGSTTAEQVDRLVVDWPSSSLKRITLIDTPGIGSLSLDVSARTHNFLAPDEDRVTAADAVLYLMKHLHATDMDFLAAFHDEEVAQATPINAIAVLSRADEVAAGRLDALESATRIAARYRVDPKVRRLVQTVVPVAGLLAVTGSTLREDEYAALAKLAASEDPPVEKLLVSVDRFVNAPTPVLTSMEREALLDRLGLFGVRLAVELIRAGGAPTSGKLSAALVERSGLDGLRHALLSQFADRRDVLKARSGLLAVEGAIRSQPVAGSDSLMNEIERITAGAHEFQEIRLLNALRSGAVSVKPEELEVMEQLLGTAGASAAARLGLDGNASDDDVRRAAHESLARWQRRAESPMATPQVADAARVLIRTCEGILTRHS
ncbi:MAG TPA: dynamin family protein [Acidimicrobiia bacterium]